MIDNHHKDNIDHTNEETASAEVSPCCAENQDFKNKYLYLNADFDNYRKRIEKEKKQWAHYGEGNVLKSVLSLVDDLERGLQQLETQHVPQELQSQFEGFKLIFKSAQGLLSKFHVEEIEAGEFDPELHEAIAQVDSEKHQPGHVVSVYEKGYKHNGHLLRPAKVSVAK